MSDLLERLIAAGTPAHLVAEVARDLAMAAARAEVAQEAIEARRERDRQRQTAKRERDNVMSRDNADVTEPAPLSRPPNEEKSNPPTHTPPDGSTRARKAVQFPCPNDCDPLDWSSFLQSRKAKMTPGAYRAITAKLEKCADAGWPPGPVLAKTVERGWQTVFEPDEMKAPANGRIPHQNGSGSLRGARPDPALDMLYQAQRDLAEEARRENEGFDRPPRLALSTH